MRYELRTARGETPAAEFFEPSVVAFEQLGAFADDLLPLLGEQATAAFYERALEARDLYSTLTSAAGPEREEVIRSTYAKMEGACFRCHSIRQHELGWDGPLVFPGIEERLVDYGVRRDLFRVGMDVWAPLGAERAGQQLADGVHAALLLVGAES